MKIDKPSAFLAYAGWISVFVLGWLMVLRTVPADKLTWTFFAIFFMVALFASAVYSGKPNKKDGIASPDDLVVKMDSTIYTQNNGGLLIGPERTDGKMVIIVQKMKEPA